MIDWANMLRGDVPWATAYAEVAKVVRQWLMAHPIAEDHSISTHDLVEGMFPESLAVGDGIYARRRLYKALMAQATRGLADCCTRGPATKKFGPSKGGPTIRPWKWHQPSQPNSEHVSKCPHCGQELF